MRYLCSELAEALKTLAVFYAKWYLKCEEVCFCFFFLECGEKGSVLFLLTTLLIPNIQCLFQTSSTLHHPPVVLQFRSILTLTIGFSV